VTLLRRSWVRTFACGLGLYAIVTAATAATGNVHLVPSLLMLGALLVPVTFVVYVFERLPVGAELIPPLATCFVVGGLVGTASAALLEYETLRNLGVLSMLGVGLIEESVKLATPLYLFLRRRVLDPSAGVLLGVAAGMGFAAFESMGYGLVELIQSRGRLGPTEMLLAVRGLAAPAGHAAWTGLVCAALWRAREQPPGRRRWAPVALAFCGAVLLHAGWDITDSTALRAGIALASFALLAAQLRRVSRPRSAQRPLKSPADYAAGMTAKRRFRADDKLLGRSHAS
jgi:protease PrsW